LLDDEKQLQKQLDEAVSNAAAAGKDGDGTSLRPSDKTRAKPKGRRDLLASGLPQVPLEVLDPELEKTAKRIGSSEACTSCTSAAASRSSSS
jgi:hypothetical protein